MIKNLIPRLAEVGKIKCGIKGEMRKSQYGKEFMLPKKLDHFIITTLERDQGGHLLLDNALMERLKNGKEKITEIPIRLLYDDIDLNFQTRYALYSGNKCVCSGDGETAESIEKGSIPCPCNRQPPEYAGNDKCKINGTLVCLIEGAEKIGGCYKFRTTSYNSVTNILSSLIFIKTITYGKLAWIPLVLTLAAKSTTIPGKQQNTTVYCASIEFRGGISNLQQLGLDISKQQIEYKLNMDHIEDNAKKQLLITQEDPIEAQDFQEEFYPENIEEQIEKDLSVQDFEATIPKGTDQKQLEIFLKLCADQFKRLVDDVKAEAAEDPGEFWSAFYDWQKKNQAKKESKDPDDFWSEPQEDYTMTEDEQKNSLLISSFSKLNKVPLQNFEKAHRDEIAKWPQSIQEIFNEKWEAKTKTPYEVFLRRQNIIENNNKPEGELIPKPGQGIVMCKADGQAKTYAACENECPGSMFKEQSCLERFPE